MRHSPVPRLLNMADATCGDAKDAAAASAVREASPAATAADKPTGGKGSKGEKKGGGDEGSKGGKKGKPPKPKPPGCEAFSKNPEAMKVVCSSNGVAPHKASRLKKLEIFMTHYPRMLGLEAFTNVRILEILHQPISAIEGMANMPLLEKVWICNTCVSEVSGLDINHQITELHLDSNQIRRIENIGHLVELRDLSMANNRIERIEGLESLSHLEKLNLANNRIRRVSGTQILKNQALTELNLSANHIVSFAEVKFLSGLRSLRSLYLTDPHFGDNPVCALSNYHTYALCNLQHLEILDTVRLSSKATQLAEATFYKKKMYYNMHIRMCRRTSNTILAHGRSVLRSKLNEVDLTLHPLMRVQKCLRRERERDEELGSSELDEYTSAQTEVSSAIEDKLELARELGELFERFSAKLRGEAQRLTSWMVTELETGGNVRIQDGVEQNSWFSSCVAFLKNSFDAKHFRRDFGVASLKVQRICKVQNRWVRNRFEDTLHGLPLFNPVRIDCPKPQLNYLFYARPVDVKTSVQDVLHGGFPNATTFEAAVGIPGVPLTNCVNIALEDQLRRARDAAISAGGGGALPPVVRAELVVVKAYLGKSLEIAAGTKPDFGDADGEREHDSCYVAVDPQNFRSGDADADDEDERSIRKWFVFDRALVLPEYVIEVDLLTTAPRAESSEERGKREEEVKIAATLANRFRSLAKPLSDYLADIRAFSERTALREGKSTVLREAKCKEVLSLKLVAPTSDPAAPFASKSASVNLNHYNIARVPSLSRFDRLERLVLSFNRIETLDFLDGVELGKLRLLDVSYNSLRALDRFPKFPALRTLDLAGNLLHDITVVDAIAVGAPGLTDLNLRSNHVCYSHVYMSKVLASFASLERLDLFELDPLERKRGHTINDRVIFESCNLGLKYRGTGADVGDMGRSTVSSPASGSSPAGDFGGRPGDEDTKWKQKVKTLNLDSRGLSAVQLAEYTSLQDLSLSENDITDIKRLVLPRELDSIQLERNRISRIAPLPASLSQLNLADNLISRIENVSHLERLTHLSLENNQLSSLDGIQHLTSLLELYLSHNNISRLQQLMHLKELTKLLILDLSHNRVTATENYRLFVIFNLKKVKVLDGESIHSKEQLEAREMFSGKLTNEALCEKTGIAPGSDCGHVKALDLQNLQIRVLDIVTHTRFPNLRILNLNKNSITDVTLFGPLPNLVILRLNENRISHVPTPPSIEDAKVGFLAASFPKLEVLELGRNRISSIAALNLQGLVNLKVLSLESNDIVQVEGLNGLPRLQQLVLADNKIKRIDHTSFQGLDSLKGLQLEENALRSLINIGPLPSLRALFLSYNRISDISELEYLSSSFLPALSKVTLKNNSVCRKTNYRTNIIRSCFNVVIIDGEVVTPDEREALQSHYDVQQAHGGQPLMADFVNTTPFPPNQFINPQAMQVAGASDPRVSVQVRAYNRASGGHGRRGSAPQRHSAGGRRGTAASTHSYASTGSVGYQRRFGEGKRR